MKRTLPENPWVRENKSKVSLARGICLGLFAGLISTVVMDLLLASIFTAVGLPAYTCFSIIGDTLARFFSLLGIEIAGSIPLGVAAHYLVGPVMGAVFGFGMSRLDILHVDPYKKGILLSIIYTEIMSQPLVAMTPILLKLTLPETLYWLGGSLVLHLIWGILMGAIVSCGKQHQHTSKNLDYRRVEVLK